MPPYTQKVCGIGLNACPTTRADLFILKRWCADKE